MHGLTMIHSILNKKKYARAEVIVVTEVDEAEVWRIVEFLF
jgi:hypothetical protein